MAYSKGGKHSREKEVALRPPDGSVEESFGNRPPKIPIGGGQMCTFGHRPRQGGVWPTAEHSVDVKTGYPQGYDKPTKGPKA